MTRGRRGSARFDQVHTALETLNVQELRQILKQLQTEDRPTRKADLVALVAAHLSAPALETVWQALTPTEQAAIAQAIHTPGGVFEPEKFKARHGTVPATSGLFSLFLFTTERGPAVPGDLCQRLLRFVPPPPPPEVPTVADLPDQVSSFGDPDPDSDLALTCRMTEHEAVADLSTLLRLVAQGAVAVSDKSKRPTATTLRSLEKHLSGGDFYPPESREHRSDQVIGAIKAFAWPMLLQAAGLARRTGARLTLTRAGRAALETAAPANVLRDCWQRWVETTLLDEFNRIDTIRGQTGKGKRGMTNLSGRRMAIEDAMVDLPPGEWVRVAEFSRYMRAAGHSFQVTRRPWGLYIGEARYGSLGYSDSHSWHLVEGRYLRCVLFEFVATLGMLDVAYLHPREVAADYNHLWGVEDLEYLSRYDGLMYVRLTALGAFVLGLTERYEPVHDTPALRLRVLPNLTIELLDGPAPPDVAVLLESWATAESETCWRLDAVKAVRTTESGRSSAELHQFLQAGDDQPLPEPVEGFLAKAERNGLALKIDAAAILVECADDELAARLATHDETRALCLRAGDRHLVVRTASESAFRKAVNRLGYGLVVR